MPVDTRGKGAAVVATSAAKGCTTCKVSACVCVCVCLGEVGVGVEGQG